MPDPTETNSGSNGLNDARLPEPGVSERGADESKIISQLTGEIEYRYHGPLPPPGMLAEYEATLSGTANRIIAMSEQSLGHEISHSKRGQLMAAILFTILVVSGLVAYLVHENVIALAILSSPGVLGVIGIFLGSRRNGA